MGTIDDTSENIYKYYEEIDKNIKFKNNKNNTKIGELSIIDSLIKYNHSYLQLFNIISGIIVVGGSIFLLRK